jgi:adenosylcobinamide-GDP ribazoletransferase
MLSKLREELECFFAGLSFYTRIPTPAWVTYKPENLNKSRKYLALIGVLVGCFAALVLLLLASVLPSSVSILLSMTATVYITGAFHEDGFADSCDGFGGGWEKAQVLSIMKDSRMGSYGVVGLILLFGLKFLMLWELFQIDLTVVLVALVLAHGVSRLMASVVMQYFSYVSHIETSKSQQVASLRLSNKDMLLSSLPIIFILLITLDWRYCVALLLSLLVAVFMGQYFKKRIGGYTGDCLGAVQQVTEVGFYLIVLLLIS